MLSIGWIVDWRSVSVCAVYAGAVVCWVCRLISFLMVGWLAILVLSVGWRPHLWSTSKTMQCLALETLHYIWWSEALCVVWMWRLAWIWHRRSLSLVPGQHTHRVFVIIWLFRTSRVQTMQNITTKTNRITSTSTMKNYCTTTSSLINTNTTGCCIKNFLIFLFSRSRNVICVFFLLCEKNKKNHLQI